MKLLLFFLSATSVGFASRLVCYYTNWSGYANVPFKIEDIEPRYCTHIVYSFLGLEEDGSVKSVDPWSDFGNEWTEGGLKKIIKLKKINPSVKILIGVGGWNEGPLKFQSMVRSDKKRKAFLDSSLNFIRNNKLDGLEIDWIKQSVDNENQDRPGLTKLIKEMKPIFEANGYLLSLSTTAIAKFVENAYDIPNLTKSLDFISILSYDFHGSWLGKTGHVAPLHAMKSEPLDEQMLNLEAVINIYIKLGAIPEKLNAGLVSYGRTFTLSNPNNFGMNAPTIGPGNIEPLPYRTFCIEDKNQLWKKYRNQEQMVPYGVAGNQWVGYEDVQSLKDKVKFIKSKKLGGVTFWSFDFDDFKGICDPARYPLLRAVLQELGNN